MEKRVIILEEQKAREAKEAKRLRLEQEKQSRQKFLPGSDHFIATEDQPSAESKIHVEAS